MQPDAPTLGILHEIRDEVRKTNERLDALRGEMRSDISGQIGGLRDEMRTELGGQIGGLRDEMRAEVGGLRAEMRTEIGGLRAEMRAELRTLGDRVERVERRQTESEVRLATEVVALAGAVREVRDLLRDDRTLRGQVDDHEQRIRALEERR